MVWPLAGRRKLARKTTFLPTFDIGTITYHNWHKIEWPTESIEVILLSNGTDSKMGIRLTSKMFWNSRDHEVKFCEGKNVLGRTSLDPFGLYFVIQYVLGDDKWWLCAILSKTYGCLQKEFYSSLFSTYFTTVCRRPAYCQKVNLRPQDFLMSSALNFINEKR